VSRQGSDLHAPGPLTGSIRRDVDVGQAARWKQTRRRWIRHIPLIFGSSPSAALSPRFLGRRFRDPRSGTFPWLPRDRRCQEKVCSPQIMVETPI